MALNDQGFRAALPFLSPIPRACEGRADPAPSVSSATHKQLDPPAPPAAAVGRRRAFRFIEFGLGRTLELGRSRRSCWRGRAVRLRGGSPKHGAERSGVSSGVTLSLADSSRVRGPRRPSAVGQQRHPQTARPAGAAWAAVGRRRHGFVLLNSGWGNAGARAIAANAAGAAARFGYGVARQSMALNDQGFRAALPFLSPIPRACEGRADPAPSVSSATHKQLDPPAPPGRRLAAVAISFWELGIRVGGTLELGRSRRTLLAGRAVRLRGGSPKHGAERSGVSSGVTLSLANSSRVRGPRRPSAVGQQRHPQTARPAGAAWAAVGRRRHRFVLLNSGWGERWSSGDAANVLARPRGSATGWLAKAWR